MIKKLTALMALALAATMAQALIMNWTVENCPWYCSDYAYVQLVAVNTGDVDEDRPEYLYSYWITLETDGRTEESWENDEGKKVTMSSEYDLREYMTFRENPGTDYDMIEGTATAPAISSLPGRFDFTGYSFYFRMLDAGGNMVGGGTTITPWFTDSNGQSLAWDGPGGVYDLYVMDDGKIPTGVWVVGIPEPCSAALMLLGTSALLLRRRTA